MKSLIMPDKTTTSNAVQFQNKYQIKTLPKHNTLFQQGERSYNMYYVIKGLVKIFQTNESGKEYIIHIYGSGDFFGHHHLLSDQMHDDNAVAVEHSEIAMFSKSEFLELVSSDKEACIKIMQNLSESLKNSEKQLIGIAYNSARKKIANALLAFTKKFSSLCNHPSFPITRHNLSSLSGLTPESVSRILTDFRKEGLIHTENGYITILNVMKMENLKN